MTFKTYKIDIGDTVLCDLCSKDWTDSDESGGYLFQSKAVAPCCADQFMKKIKKYNEERFIYGYCPKDMSFADWIRCIR